MYSPYYGNQPDKKGPPTMPAALKAMPQPKQISLHEMQLAELASQGSGIKPSFGVSQANVPLPAPVTSIQWRGVYDSTLYLDSSYKDSAGDVQFTSLSYQVKPLNNGNDISGIAQIRIESFYFPRLNVTVGKPDPFYARRIYMLIDELPSAAAVGTRASNQFHFELAVGNVNSVAVQLEPVNHTLYFQVPIQTLSSITLRFLSPPNMDLLTLPPDVITVFMMPNEPPPSPVNPARLTKFAFINTQQWAAISTNNVAAGPIQPASPYTSIALTPNVAAWIRNPQTTNTTFNITLDTSLGWFIANVGNRIITPPNYYLPYGYFEITGITEGLISSLAPPFAPINPVDYPGFINSTGIRMQIEIRKNRVALQMRFSSLQTPSINGMLPTHV